MKTNYLKLGVLGLMMMVGTAMNAQQTSGDATEADGTTTLGAIEKNGHAKPLNGTVRVIDNKGTKKYLQVKNGLTLLTDTTPDGGIVSTWQLGGTLTDDTTITLSDGTNPKKLVIDGVNYSLENIAETAVAAATATTAVSGTETGFTLLVRNEATGNVEKLLATDLITSGQTYFTAPANDQLTYDVSLATGTNAGSTTMTANQIPLPEFSKVWVYRNGAKLIAGLDYTIAGSVVTLVPSTTAPNDWKVYADDVIEVQYYK